MGIFFTDASALAWGHGLGLRFWPNAHLITPLVQQNAINYCLQINDPRFDVASIRRQVEMALHLWLKPLEWEGVWNTQVRESSCQENLFNLKVVIGPETVHTGLGAYQLSTTLENRAFSLVKIDTQYALDYLDKSYSFVDFAQLMAPGHTLEQELYSVSLTDFMIVPTYANQRGLDVMQVYLNSYRALIHEFGHSFGLCDTLATRVESQCDPNFRTQTHPTSVMQDAIYFFLTPDDAQGIQNLYRRYHPRQP